ncbi:hypothetical protein CERSUDRAFT_160914 [Gelatoporia subvermispora B]|uniref:P-loop containing nucleoside triphosphate hydrolase protein n=1 Tax=Ceriporiopsis subvermispora (strain B) TaxID=914234 RepID=M2QL78_CERS8|nr:hypothetical protein CERSUDRAFT_160914 [Gelatoporia subvermispora B]
MKRTSGTPENDSGVADVDGSVDLFDALHSTERRRLLDVINNLRKTGAQLDIDLPTIAVIGMQSAGKSSLIEAISGIKLPRASGTCTRCPTECQLSSSAEPWRCTVTLRYITDLDDQPLGVPREHVFGDTIVEKDEVEARIRRAQRAILNPTRDFQEFLNGPDADVEVSERSFSRNSIVLDISGPDIVDLSFVDLPGLIASVSDGGNPEDIDLVRKLATSYIKKVNCIILLTVACETDFENQAAHQLAKTVDRTGKRTIGVLTKPDRIPTGEEERWLRFIKNEHQPLEHGWFSVRQPDSQALRAGITYSEARQQELDYFAKTPPWSTLDRQCLKQLGTANVVERLSEVLLDLIRRTLPGLMKQVKRELKEVEAKIQQLPPAPGDDALAQVLLLLNNFSRDLSHHMDGTPYDGLVQSLRPAQDEFRRTIRGTAPDFRPYESSKKRADPLKPDELMTRLGVPCSVAELCRDSPPRVSTIHDVVSDDEDDEDDRRAIYVDEIMTCADSAVTRELPGHIPFTITRDLIVAILGHWRSPTELLLTFVHERLLKYVEKLIDKHFVTFAEGKFQQKVSDIVEHFILEGAETARSRVVWLLAVEQPPFTRNYRYFSDYRAKYLEYFRGCRHHIKHRSVIQTLKTHKSYFASSSRYKTDDPVGGVLSGLNKIGFRDVKSADLAKLLPPDEYEPALGIMADVRAYFHVAYKRFTDLVPMALDHELVLGLTRDGALDKRLLKELGVTGPDALARCEDLLREPPKIAQQRADLVNKKTRLESARVELARLGV